MRRYESFSIIDPEVSPEDRVPLFARFSEIIEQQGGMLVNVDEWGARKLAYEIRKRTRGYYVRLDFCGSGELVQELERFFRIDDRVIKYLTVLLAKDVDMDQIKEEMAKAEEARKAKAEEARKAKAEKESETESAQESKPAAPSEPQKAREAADETADEPAAKVEKVEAETEKNETPEKEEV